MTERSAPPVRDRADLSQLAEFDQVIDVRTPAEFAEDHLPGALNLPVLSNEERAQVGTLYKQVSPFQAKKLGAALVARNIATFVPNKHLALVDPGLSVEATRNQIAQLIIELTASSLARLIRTRGASVCVLKMATGLPD